MRIKIKLPLKKIKVEENALATSKYIHTFLGNNNKWHDMPTKAYSSSMIRGGKREKGYFIFDNDAHILFNTEDEEILAAVLDNILNEYEFDIVEPKFRSGVNILEATYVRYYSKGKDHFITNDNKSDFELYVKNKYAVDIKILNINANVDIKYKSNSAIKSSNILFQIKTEDTDQVASLFNTGIGGSTAIGFGFVSNVNLKLK